MAFTPEQVDAIPTELRNIPHWVGSEKKTPLIPGSEAKASVTDSSTWGTFEKALNGIEDGKYEGLGFVFTDEDPYVFIDLDCAKEKGKPLPPTSQKFQEQDKKNQSWINAFQSYAERSQSGLGYHIIVKGVLPKGFKKDHVELYSTGRFAIFTGNVVLKAPIVERQEKLDEVVEALGGVEKQSVEVWVSKPEVESDEQIKSKLEKREFGSILWNGEWEGHHWPSQSEADMALISDLCFFSKNDEQVARLFRMSALGQRLKANNPRDPYVEITIAKARASEPPPVDFTVWKAAALSTLAEKPEYKIKRYPRPPGLLGEIADYIYGSAVHPVYEYAIAGALAFTGFLGRQYNISTTGLNEYYLILGPTGSGKSGAADGMRRLFDQVREAGCIDIKQFIGPADFASGAGLKKHMSVAKENACIICVTGEYGIRLGMMTDPRALPSEQGLKRDLLDLYNLSGEKDFLESTVYSVVANNTGAIQSPALTLLGESTPELFLSKISEASISDGLIPRFTVVAYEGELQLSNRNRQTKAHASLVKRLSDIGAYTLMLFRSDLVVPVKMSREAERRDRQYEEQILAMRRGFPEGVTQHILNRTRIKTLKMAAKCAVLENPETPEVTLEQLNWAIDFNECDYSYMVSRFEKGFVVEEGDSARQLDLVRDKIKRVLTKPPSAGSSKQTQKNRKMLETGFIQHSFISNQLSNLEIFKKDRRGAEIAIDAALQRLVKFGELRYVDKARVQTEFQYTGVTYQLSEDISITNRDISPVISV